MNAELQHQVQNNGAFSVFAPDLLPGRLAVSFIQWLCLLCLHTGACAKTKTQSEPVVAKPMESHTLTCTYSGLSTSTDFAWITQKEVKGLEWIAYISGPSGDTKSFSESVQGRFTISRDNGNQQVQLQMNQLETVDSTVYYCARDHINSTWLSSCTKPHNGDCSCDARRGAFNQWHSSWDVSRGVLTTSILVVMSNVG